MSLNEIKLRLGRTTPGPWKFISDRNAIPAINRVEAGRVICKGVDDFSIDNISDADGDFIAHSRTDMEYLVNELESLQKKYEEAKNNIYINIKEW